MHIDIFCVSVWMCIHMQQQDKWVSSAPRRCPCRRQSRDSARIYIYIYTFTCVCVCLYMCVGSYLPAKSIWGGFG